MSSREPGAALRGSASFLCGLATVTVVAIAVGFAPVLVEEDPLVVGYLVGAPLLAAVLALVCSLRSPATWAAVVVSLLGAASVAWAVCTVVGLGLYLLLPSLLLFAAAVLLVVRAVESARGQPDRPSS